MSPRQRVLPVCVAPTTQDVAAYLQRWMIDIADAAGADPEPWQFQVTEEVGKRGVTTALELHSEGAEELCDLAEKLMRSGHEPQARPLWDEARAGFPDDVWIYVQAGIEHGDIGNHATALTWLTPGVKRALTGDPESALEQLVPLPVCLGPEAGQPADPS